MVEFTGQVCGWKLLSSECSLKFSEEPQTKSFGVRSLIHGKTQTTSLGPVAIPRAVESAPPFGSYPFGRALPSPSFTFSSSLPSARFGGMDPGPAVIVHSLTEHILLLPEILHSNLLMTAVRFNLIPVRRDYSRHTLCPEVRRFLSTRGTKKV